MNSTEFPPGIRRLCVRIAFAILLVSFGALLSFAICWAWIIAPASDNLALAALILIASATGMARGIDGRLRMRNSETGEFAEEPSRFDAIVLGLSAGLLIAGCCVGGLSLG